MVDSDTLKFGDWFPKLWQLLIAKNTVLYALQQSIMIWWKWFLNSNNVNILTSWFIQSAICINYQFIKNAPRPDSDALLANLYSYLFISSFFLNSWQSSFTLKMPLCHQIGSLALDGTKFNFGRRFTPCRPCWGNFFTSGPAPVRLRYWRLLPVFFFAGERLFFGGRSSTGKPVGLTDSGSDGSGSLTHETSAVDVLLKPWFLSSLTR